VKIRCGCGFLEAVWKWDFVGYGRYYRLGKGIIGSETERGID
jgi:hypothetical protein